MATRAAKGQRNVIPALPFCHVRLSGPKPQQKAYPKHLKTLGDHLRKKRLDSGLLQKEVAAQMGVDTASIVNWESNRIQPMVHCLPAILAFLGHNPLPEPKSLAEKLISYRQRLGLRRRKLAELLSVDEGTLARWERFERVPKGRYLKTIESLLEGVRRL